MKFSSININYSNVSIYKEYIPIKEHENFIIEFLKESSKCVILEGVYGSGKSFVTSLITDSLTNKYDLENKYEIKGYDKNYSKLLLNGNYADIKETYKNLLKEKYHVSGDTIEDILGNVEKENIKNNKQTLLIHDEFGRIFENLNDSGISYTMQFLQDFAEYIVHKTTTIKTLFIVHKSLSTYFKDINIIRDFKRVEKRYFNYKMESSLESFTNIISSKYENVIKSIVEVSYYTARIYGQDSRTLFNWIDSDSQYSLMSISQIRNYNFIDLYKYYSKELDSEIDAYISRNDLTDAQKNVYSLIYLWNKSEMNKYRPLDKLELRNLIPNFNNVPVDELEQKGFVRFNKIYGSYQIYEGLGINYKNYIFDQSVINPDEIDLAFKDIFGVNTYIYHSNKDGVSLRAFDYSIYDQNDSNVIYIDVKQELKDELIKYVQTSKLKLHPNLVKYGKALSEEVEYLKNTIIQKLNNIYYKNIWKKIIKTTNDRISDLEEELSSMYKINTNNLQLVQKYSSKRFITMMNEINELLMNNDIDGLVKKNEKKSAEFKLLYFSIFSDNILKINNDNQIIFSDKCDWLETMERELINSNVVNLNVFFNEWKRRTDINSKLLETIICAIICKNIDRVQIKNGEYVWITFNAKSIKNLFDNEITIQKIEVGEELKQFHDRIFNSKYLTDLERDGLKMKISNSDLANYARTFMMLLSKLSITSRSVTKHMEELELKLVTLLKRIEINYSEIENIHKEYGNNFESVYVSLMEFPNKLLEVINLSEDQVKDRIGLDKYHLSDSLIEVLEKKEEIKDWNGIDVSKNLSDKAKFLKSRIEIMINSLGKNLPEIEKKTVLAQLLDENLKNENK